MQFSSGAPFGESFTVSLIAFKIVTLAIATLELIAATVALIVVLIAALVVVISPIVVLPILPILTILTAAMVSLHAMMTHLWLLHVTIGIRRHVSRSRHQMARCRTLGVLKGSPSHSFCDKLDKNVLR